MIAAYHSGDVTPDDVERIAYAGAYDQPGYYVFRDMAQAIEAARSRESLIDLVRLPPAKFVLAYHETVANEPNAMRFSKSALAIIHRLDAAEPSRASRAARARGESACEP